jgi:hypothetical protein
MITANGNKSKFILSEDHQSGKQYISHANFPRFIAEVIPMTGDIQNIDLLINKYKTGARTRRINDKYYVLGVLEFYDNFDFTTQQDADNLSKIMSEMGDWFYSLLKNENT